MAHTAILNHLLTLAIASVSSSSLLSFPSCFLSFAYLDSVNWEVINVNTSMLSLWCSHWIQALQLSKEGGKWEAQHREPFVTWSLHSVTLSEVSGPVMDHSLISTSSPVSACPHCKCAVTHTCLHQQLRPLASTKWSIHPLPVVYFLSSASDSYFHMHPAAYMNIPWPLWADDDLHSVFLSTTDICDPLFSVAGVCCVW